MNIINKKIELADGRVIEIETGKLAKQADGSAVVKMGGTMLLATVCAAKEVKEGTDFMPLTVDYKEKFYSAGRFPGGFMKREGKSSDYEILISRLIDRPIRPLWPDDFHLARCTRRPRSLLRSRNLRPPVRRSNLRGARLPYRRQVRHQPQLQ